MKLVVLTEKHYPHWTDFTARYDDPPVTIFTSGNMTVRVLSREQFEKEYPDIGLAGSGPVYWTSTD